MLRGMLTIDSEKRLQFYCDMDKRFLVGSLFTRPAVLCREVFHVYQLKKIGGNYSLQSGGYHIYKPLPAMKEMKRHLEKSIGPRQFSAAERCSFILVT
jgi:hypothetical protein